MRHLATKVADRIAGQIREGLLEAGSRLPPEREVAGAMQVSRTVIREAFAALRAKGLLVTRQGSGTFVTANPCCLKFHIGSEWTSVARDAHGLLELRTAVEAEAAALAAERSTPDQLASIHQALRAAEAASAGGHSMVDEDIAFHRAIAAASGNPLFCQLLDVFGGRFGACGSAATPTSDMAMRIHKQHWRIYKGIFDQRASDARRAMRLHLRGPA